MLLEACLTWSVIVFMILFVDESVWPPGDVTCHRVTAPGKKRTNSADFGPNGKVFDDRICD